MCPGWSGRKAGPHALESAHLLAIITFGYQLPGVKFIFKFLKGGSMGVCCWDFIGFGFNMFYFKESKVGFGISWGIRG